jgi:predicted RecA/RadA family phage recombinase
MAHGDPYHGLGEYGIVEIRAAAAIVAGDFVKVGTNGVIPATDGSGCFGVAINAAAAAGNTVRVRTRGVVLTTAASGVNFDQGDACYLATDVTVDAGSTTNPMVGRVVYADPATAGTVYLYLTPNESTYGLMA